MKHIVRSFLIGVLFVSLSADTYAARPRAQELVGVVQSIDLQSKSITVDSKTFELTKQTKFIAENHFADPGTLKSGDLAKVHYRSPLIGKKFATKVVWPATTRSSPIQGQRF